MHVISYGKIETKHQAKLNQSRFYNFLFILMDK